MSTIYFKTISSLFKKNVWEECYGSRLSRLFKRSSNRVACLCKYIKFTTLHSMTTLHLPENVAKFYTLAGEAKYWMYLYSSINSFAAVTCKSTLFVFSAFNLLTADKFFDDATHLKYAALIYK